MTGRLPRLLRQSGLRRASTLVCRIVICVAALLATATAQDRASLERLPSIRSDVRLVLVPVTVTDRRGAVLTGLAQEHFKLFEEKTPQAIASFKEEDAPCSVGIVFDVSGSMKPRMAQAKSALRAFFETANSDDEAFLMTISSAPGEISGFTTEFGDLLDRLQFRKASGSTAFVDTLYLALSRMRAAHHARRALLVISDGMDNHSRYSKSELKSVALEANVQVHTIALYDPPLNKKPIELQEERRGLLLLDEVARETGGLHFVAANQTDIKECVTKIGKALRSEYVIGYQPRSIDRSGKWRQIQVKSTLPDVRVYARSGYYAY